jgi:hypothetical protein
MHRVLGHITSIYGTTPLHLTSGPEMIRFLLYNSADPEAADTASCKMAHHLVFAMRRTPEKAMEYLVETHR